MANSSKRNRRNAKVGKRAQDVIDRRLISIGLLCVERIATPVVIQRDKRGKISDAFYEAPVAADTRALFPFSLDGFTKPLGVSVLIETKAIGLRDHKRRLRMSDFKPHQPKALTDHDEFGLSLVGWVSAHGAAVAPWSSLGLKSGTSIDWESFVSSSIRSPEDISAILQAKYL